MTYSESVVAGLIGKRRSAGGVFHVVDTQNDEFYCHEYTNKKIIIKPLETIVDSNKKINYSYKNSKNETV